MILLSLSTIDNLAKLSNIMDVLDDAMLFHVLDKVLLLPVCNTAGWLSDSCVLNLQTAT